MFRETGLLPHINPGLMTQKCDMTVHRGGFGRRADRLRGRADVMAAAIALGGTITGEHGVGRAKRAALPDQLDTVVGERGGTFELVSADGSVPLGSFRTVTVTEEGDWDRTVQTEAPVAANPDGRTCADIQIVRANGTASEPERACWPE